ncbi:hypothetical protein N0V82_009493 [Gnomoniopsis sp. IMI 355080]|nr:hypothetical protein N0V82_009493 [Gnomoniopsis sp. IMI 355080]
MHTGSSLGLFRFHQPNRTRFAWCALILISVWVFHFHVTQDQDPGSLFAHIEETADSWSTEISNSIPWTTVTSKLKDWQWENNHAGMGFDEINLPTQEQLQPDPYTITTFKKIWLENEIGGPLTDAILAPISNLCASVSWHDDVVLNMESSGGGLGNLRIIILDLIYFAMQTGSHIILPGYIKRTEGTLYWNEKSNGNHSFSHLFDADFIISTLGNACPQMHVFRSIEEAGFPSAVPELFSMMRSRTDKDANTNTTALRARLREWIDEKPEGYQDDARNMVTVEVPFITHDMRTKPRLRMALGRLMKFNNQVRTLAATAIFNLRRSRHLEEAIDPSQQIYQEAYYGMHLRTEVDIGGDWESYKEQATTHLAMCKKLNLSLIYVAGGNQEHIEQFAIEAQQSGISVISKLDLLASGEEQAVFDASAFESLSWDQKGALDFEILSRSSFFSGPAGSSFTWNVALRRAFYIEDERLDIVYAYGINKIEPTVVYDDGLSRIAIKQGSGDKVWLLEFDVPEGMYP